MSWGPRIAKVVASTACILFLLRFFLTSERRDGSVGDGLLGSRTSTTSRSAAQHDPLYDHIQNETLGFENVYAIGLKDRSDRRDYLNLAASLVGFRVEWLDGVRGEDIIPKALPERWNHDTMRPAQAGCWRAHMNALVEVVQRRQSTALIMEDDADWDVNLKSQLTEFARGVGALTGDQSVSKDAPYGTNWDLLWIGGCASGPSANETEFYVVPEDPTVPMVHRRGTWGGPPDPWAVKFPVDSTRFVYRADMGCCLYGYAVSYNGARRILGSLSVDHLEAPVDNAMSDLCAGAQGYPRINCLAPFPNLIGTYRQAGSSTRDSDIENTDNAYLHGAEAWNLVYSARMNLLRVLAGEPTVLSQWKDDDVPWSSPELDLSTFEYPRGYYVSLE